MAETAYDYLSEEIAKSEARIKRLETAVGAAMAWLEFNHDHRPDLMATAIRNAAIPLREVMDEKK